MMVHREKSSAPVVGSEQASRRSLLGLSYHSARTGKPHKVALVGRLRRVGFDARVRPLRAVRAREALQLRTPSGRAASGLEAELTTKLPGTQRRRRENMRCELVLLWALNLKEENCMHTNRISRQAPALPRTTRSSPAIWSDLAAAGRKRELRLVMLRVEL
eukprot:4613980-Pleurochrysis_carterae.AAC.3